MSIRTLINKVSFFLLVASLLLIPLYYNKNVLRFRISQQALLYFFVILLIFLISLKFLFFEKKELSISYKNQSPYHKTMFLYIVILFFSFIISSNKWVSFNDLMLFLSYFALYYIVITEIKKNKQIIIMLYIIFFTAFVVSLYTIIQYYGLDPFLPEMNILTSTIGQRNWISNYLFMVMPILFIFFLIQQKSKIKILYLILLSLIYINLIVLQSRSIWITILAVLLLGSILFLKLKLVNLFSQNKKWLLMLVVIFIIILVFYSSENTINRSPSFVEQRIVSAVKGGDVSINQRILYMHVVYEMFKERPFFGLGIGLYKMNYLYYQAEVINNLPKFHQYSANAQEAHNEYLQLLAEVGIIGLIIFLAIFFFFYIQIIYFLLHKNISEKDKAIIFGLLMSITGFLIHSLFTFPLHVPALGMTFFGILGINVSYINIIGQNNLNDLEKAFKGNNHNNNHSKNIHNIFSNQYFVFLTIIITIIVTIYLLTFLVFNPYYAELEYFSGLRHTADKNYPAALNKFEKAYQLNPYDGKNLHALGGTYYNLKKYVNAEYYLKKAKHYITDTNTFYNLGLTYKETNQLQLAKKEFETVIRLAPDYLEAYYELGLLYFIADKYLEAIGKWGKILEIDPSFENKYIVKYNIGLTYIKMDNDLEAVKYFREALKEAPEDSPVMDDIEKELLNINKNQKLEK